MALEYLKKNNPTSNFVDIHEKTIKDLMDKAPHGSGFDSGTKLIPEKCDSKKLVFETEFHHLNDDGYYDGWSRHIVTVHGDLLYGYDLTVSGIDRNDIKDYIAEVFSSFLDTNIEEPIAITKPEDIDRAIYNRPKAARETLEALCRAWFILDGKLDTEKAINADVIAEITEILQQNGFYPDSPIKTLSQWHESKKDLTKFLSIGDIVSDDITEYAINVLPPHKWSADTIQIGEPYSTDENGNPTWITFKKINGQWRYAGTIA
jgi:hypothetical protein